MPTSVTGRNKTREPEMQNIPIRTETGRSIRKAFQPRIVIYCDYSSLELKIMRELGLTLDDLKGTL